MNSPDRHPSSPQRLSDASLEIERLLSRGDLPPAQFEASAIQCQTVKVAMRDGTQLATDLYLPPVLPAPIVVIRTPYNRSFDGAVSVFYSFARRGYAVVAQDCRGTGGSEPDSWDYYVYESEDGYDCIDWITQQQWFGGFIGSCGGSYTGQTQWCMATHPAMSATVPMVSGLGIAFNPAHLYMLINTYARTVGKGADKVAVSMYDMERVFEKDTMEGGYFNEPLHRPFTPELLQRFPHLRELPPRRPSAGSGNTTAP